MLDPKLVRENPELVKENLKKRGLSTDIVDEFLEVDNSWRRTLHELNELRKERNQLAIEIGRGRKELVEKAKEVSEKIKELEKKLVELEERRRLLLMNMPNILHEAVPFGESDADNVPIRYWGNPMISQDMLKGWRYPVEPKVVSFKPKDHIDLLIPKLVDTERAAKVAGSRFYYEFDEIVYLDLALIRFALDFLKKQGFRVVIPPYMARRYIEEGATSFGDFEDVIYKIEGEDLYLIPTAEHVLLGMHANEIIPGDELPLLYAGVSPCFRKEAGAHGRDTKGIFRVHQFHKVEQFVFCTPEESWEWFERLIANAEKLFQLLEIPYRVVEICTGDIGYVAARKYDLEAWLPGQRKFREMVSCSNCTDWQARRLNIRFRYKTSEKPRFVHTLNSTAIATQRTIIAIIENHQQEDGTVKIPKVLWKYLPFKEIPAKNWEL